MAKIMVVDDEPDIITLLKKMLEKRGYEVVSANTGKEALKMLKTEKPDLMLLDVMMPFIDGWETSRRIKNREDTKDILVAMLTVRASLDDKEKSFKFSKADAHLTKPLNEEKILGTVEWLFKNKPYKETD